MNEHRNAELGGNFKRRTRLRCIDQEIAARTLDEQTAQSKFPDGALSFTGGPVAVIGVDRRLAVNAARMSRDERCEIIVHGHDGVVRHAAVRIGDQLGRNTDDAGAQFAVADVL